MKKPIQSFFKTNIRPVEPRDFNFIHSLAGEFPTFTVPSEYVLWFWSRFHPDYCRVLEQDSGDLKAYLLAIPTTEPPNGIAVWQIAATGPNHALALEHFAAYLHDLVERTHTTSVFFTTSQDSALLRLIRLLANQFANCEVEQLDPVPTGQGEHQYRLSIGSVN
jgi:hypothetical protein